MEFDDQQTAFRLKEKQYQLHKEQIMSYRGGRMRGNGFKIRETDFSNVIDVNGSGSKLNGIRSLSIPDTARRAFDFPERPGLYYFPAVLGIESQQELLAACFEEYLQPPARTNHFNTHGWLPDLWTASLNDWKLTAQPSPGAPVAGNSLHVQHQSSRAHDSGAEDCNYATNLNQQRAAPHHSQMASNSKASGSGLTSSEHACASCQAQLHPPHDPNISSLPNSMPNNPYQQGKLPPSPTATSLSVDDQPCCSPAGRLAQNQPPGDGSCLPPMRNVWTEYGGQGPSAKQLLRKVRWASLGPYYNWTRREYESDIPHRPLPPGLEAVARELGGLALHLLHCSCLNGGALPADGSVNETTNGTAVGTANGGRASPCNVSSAADGRALNADAAAERAASHAALPVANCPWQSVYAPNAALVNFYHEGDTLGGHVDDAEQDLSQPIVSVSLGCDAVFLIGGHDRGEEPLALMLHSGDVVVLAGPARRCYHGVPRVLTDRGLPQGMRPGEVGAKYRDVMEAMQQMRINISIRRV